MADEFENESNGIIDRIKESPRTVSALIIILIVAAAIYAFSGNDEQENTGIGETETLVVNEEETNMDEEGDTAGAMIETTPQVVSQEKLAEESAQLPAGVRSSEGFEETAQAGDGITHLARRATTRWLSDNQAGYTVTNEHRIYIEDYIQNRIGTAGLNLGETKTISFDMVTEAVAAAGNLSDSQLRNLTQYSSVL